MSEPGSEEIAGLTYEAALAQLDALIEKLEGGSIPLEDAITAYERGTRLARHCEHLLDRTERRVTALMVGADGRTTEAPLEAEVPEPPARAEGGEGAAASAPAQPPAPRRESGGLFEAARRQTDGPPVDPDDVPF
jgi:exodeoxyribonuclease VII small subunit